MFMIR